MANIGEILLTESTTRVQAIRRLRIIREFLNYTLFENPKKGDFGSVFEEFRKNYLEKSAQQENLVLENEKERDIIFIKNLGESIFKQFDASNMNQAFKELEKAIYGAKLLIVYVPFEIPEKDVVGLSVWVKKTIGADSLLDFKYDPNLVGGCALSFKGKYKDFSLRQRFLENRDQIVVSLNSYKTQVAAQPQKNISSEA